MEPPAHPGLQRLNHHRYRSQSEHILSPTCGSSILPHWLFSFFPLRSFHYSHFLISSDHLLHFWRGEKAETSGESTIPADIGGVPVDDILRHVNYRPSEGLVGLPVAEEEEMDSQLLLYIYRGHITGDEGEGETINHPIAINHDPNPILPSSHPNSSIPLENVFEASHPNDTPETTKHTPPTAPSTQSNITTPPQLPLHTPLSLLTLSLIALTNFLLTAYFNPTITENRFWPLNPLLTLLTQIEDLLFDTVGYVLFMTVFTVWLALVEFAEWNGAWWLIERVIDEDDDDWGGEGEGGGGDVM
jgi:hypothetical protein